MKKLFFALLICMFALTLGACSSATQQSKSESTTTPIKSGKVLVVYFSHTGENYGVGNIEKGNTHIVADMIAKATKADEFEIKTVKSYPTGYDDATAVAKQEQSEKARPELSTKLSNLANYDTIFVGYPIWWGDMPMAVYTFFDSYDFAGKTIIPFATHAGSGLSNTDANIRTLEPKAIVVNGKAFIGADAQKQPDKLETEVNDWIKTLKLN